MLKRAICGIGFAALASLPAYAQRGTTDEPVDGTRDDCIPIRRIDRTTVVDDRTILFYMRGDTIYRNVLQTRCPDLGRLKRFSYQNRTGQLCRIDSITPYDPFGFAPGISCGLGEFRAITEEEAELLKLGPDAADVADDAIEIKTTDLPVEDSPPESADEERQAPAESEPQ